MRLLLLRITLGVIAAFQLGFGALFLFAPGLYPDAVGLESVPAWAPWMFALFGARALGFGAGMIVAMRDPLRHRSWIVIMIGVQVIDWIATVVAVLQGSLTITQVSTAGFMPVLFVVALVLFFPRAAAQPAELLAVMTSAALFEWLADTSVYRDIHVEAALLLPPAERGRRWLDVGCGPGLMTRTAAGQGYDALGVDTSASMIRAARRLSRDRNSTAQFEVGKAGDPRPGSADVVSAASLLYVVPDPEEVAAAMWDAVRPGGTVLVVETTASMTPDAVRRLDQRTWSPDDRRAISMWAQARGGRALDPRRLASFANAETTFHPLLSGLVGAWLFRRA